MLSAIILDSGPLNLAAQDTSIPDAQALRVAMVGWMQQGATVYIPEIADYEVRREWTRIGNTDGLRRLDELTELATYLPLTTAQMREAARIWADIRNLKLPTTDNKALDGDVILCAQALSLGIAPTEIVVATSNVKHLQRFLPASEWKAIQP
jgi:predicted nucleic acid-binding protein